MSWSEFSAAAPELADAIRARFEANPHHVLGTIRPSGAPRLSGTGVAFEDGELLVGMMPDSQKLADVRRDPRIEIHSAPLEAELAGGDAKVVGAVEEKGPTSEAPGTNFKVALALASLVRVDGDELVFQVWRAGRGVTEIRRK